MGSVIKVLKGLSDTLSEMSNRGVINTFSALPLNLESLRQTCLQQRHFRRNPDNYLLQLETKLIQSILPL